MAENNSLFEKLNVWVQKHPEEADVLHINLTTQRQFTLRDVLGQLKKEKETGVALADEELLQVKDLVGKWLPGVKP